MSASRMAMANHSTNSVRSSAISDVFIVIFTFLAHLLLTKVISIGYLQSDPRSHYLCMLACSPLVEYFTSPTQNFRLIRAVRFLSRVKQILSIRQHVPNKRCVLNNDVRLITRFYGIHVVKFCKLFRCAEFLAKTPNETLKCFAYT